MKPPRFAYDDPVTRADALSLLDTYADDAKVLAGGQSLIPLLNMRLAQPAHLVDINRIPDLAYIREVNGGLAIGALTRQRDVERSALVQRLCPLLAEATAWVAHAPIRSRGTICGSLAHADPAAELPAVLVALGGHVRTESLAGARTILGDAFFVHQLLTALEPTELLTEAWFPALPPHSGAAFREVSRRHGDFALAGAAAQVTLAAAGTIEDARLALLGVDVVPLRSHEAEEFLRGQPPVASVFVEAGRRAAAAAHPTTDLHASAEYRRYVAGELVAQALEIAAGRAREGVSE